MTEAKVEAQLNMDNLYHNRCPCCSGESFKECVKFDHRDIVECLSCHHQFAKTFSPKELTRLYQQDYYSSVDDPRILEWIKLNADVWDALIKNIPTTADLLDIGAGTGGFLLRCQKQLSEVTYYAVESSGAAREFIEQEVKGVEFLAENADDLSSIASSSVSCITLLQVLEHVTYPRVVLEEIYRILKPGGHFILTIPNRNSYLVKRYGYQDPYCYLNQTHLHFFSSLTISRLLTSVGFENHRRLINWGDKKSFMLNMGQYLMRLAGVSSELRYICQKQ